MNTNGLTELHLTLQLNMCHVICKLMRITPITQALNNIATPCRFMGGNNIGIWKY